MSPSAAHPGDPSNDRLPEGLDAWVVTGRISPRRVVRAAVVGADGQPINSYPLIHPITGHRPVTPWAVHLADGEGRFRLLCADLDARPSAADARRDATRLSGLLTELGMPHVVCESGPTGGRHVWLGLRESVDAELAGVLARLLKAWLPTLDIAPLVNPTSGCVRPPGSPHRLGGTSRILSGSPAVLLHPTVTADQVRRLVTRLADRLTASHTPTRQGRRPLSVVDGLPYLPGVRRPLAPAGRALLQVTPAGDCSAVLWRILCGAVVAHWQFTDLTALKDAPGLEHIRTMRSGTIRLPRPPSGPASSASVLRRQWTRAVDAMARAPLDAVIAGQDPTFDARAEAGAAVVRVVQGSADATAGRWAGRAGLAHRRVLDALCLYHLQAVRCDRVEADIRRLALTCGIDRETVRRSLLALAGDGWIRRTQPATGRRGACWTIDPDGRIHTSVVRTLSQADPRPAGAGPAQRLTLLTTLTDRLQAGAHDAFAPTGGLGLQAGTLYGRLADPMDTLTLGRLMGCTVDTTLTILGRLADARLIKRADACWQRTGVQQLRAAALELGTAGRGNERAARYAVERDAWAWWLAELDWMRAPRQATTDLAGRTWRAQAVCCHRRPWPAHPRRRGGRADFAAARRIVCARTTRRTDPVPTSAVIPPRPVTSGWNPARGENVAAHRLSITLLCLSSSVEGPAALLNVR